MLVTLTTTANAAHVQARLQELGLWTQKVAAGSGSPASLIIAQHSAQVETALVADIEGVAEVCTAPSPHPKIDAQRGETTIIAGAAIGCDAPAILMAGPCSVESPAQIHASAKAVADAGATFLRGGAFKPRSSPYSFSGHGLPALGWLREAATEYGLGVVTEVMSEGHAEAVAEVADIVQIGSRNMHNFALLEAVGRCATPVLLKRGMAATIEEWLLAGEHLKRAGSGNVIFCERGIHSFDPSTRNLLDLSAVALMRHVHRQAVVVDPSHAAGRRDLIIPLAKAAVAAGACGLLVEAHPDPAHAQSDGPQALTARELKQLEELIASPIVAPRTQP